MASRRRTTTPTAITRAVAEFLATEVAGGVVLVIAAATALAWANSPWRDSYHTLWETRLAVEVGSLSISLDLRHWVNEGLMALFFLVVGLEIKRELVEGELRDPRRAALPVVAALGGMVVPAALYLAILGPGPASRGWGIPMATDIAFALGVAALVARRLPPPLRLFLLTLAIVDDIGAIVVIAFFYSGGVNMPSLGVAFVVLLAVYALSRLGVTATPLFVCLGTLLWLALHSSGVHGTLAGVAMGLLAPTSPSLAREIVLSRGAEIADVSTAAAARSTSRIARLSVSQVVWLAHALHPWTSFAIVPAFALANAGLPLSASALGAAASSRVAVAIVVALVAGKTIGISAFAWIACRVGLATLPAGATFSQVFGLAALGGIGFTVSLFISDLAFGTSPLADQAKAGILAATVLASCLGALLLAAAGRRAGRHPRNSGAPTAE